MALKFLTGSAASRTDLYDKLNTFLVSQVGWTLLDQGAADGRSYRVYNSKGESGNEDIYLRYGPYSSTDSLEVHAYGFWNATTHAGSREAYANGSSKIVIQEGSSFSFWCYADLDRIFVITKVWSTYYGQYSGLIRRFWDSRIAKLKAAVTAGSSVLCSVSDASILQKSRYYIITDGAKMERVKVVDTDTASTPNHILLESVTQAYAVDAKIGEDPQPVIVTDNNAPGSFNAVSRFDGWTSVSGQPGTCGAAHGGLAANADPETRYGSIVLFPWLVAQNGWDCTELRGEIIGVFAHGGGGATAEQLVTSSSGNFRFFNLAGSGWCAVKES